MLLHRISKIQPFSAAQWTIVRRHGVTVSFALMGFGEPDVAREFQLRYFFVHIKSPNNEENNNSVTGRGCAGRGLML